MKLMGQIAAEWDQIVCNRAHDIESGVDATYNDVLVPFITSTVDACATRAANILDVGCGCGFLTNRIAAPGRRVTGVDISERSITYCADRYADSGIRFVHTDIYAFSSAEPYDICMATMVLHNLPDLPRFFRKMADLLTADGLLLLCIPHPFFWFSGKEFARRLPFDYREESMFSVPFGIKNNHRYQANFTYFHRPLAVYLNDLLGGGFAIVECRELYECDGETRRKPFPDILSIMAKKSG